MKNNSQKIKSMKIPVLPKGSKDVQLIFAFKKGKKNYADVIQIILLPGEVYTSIIRNEKIDILIDHGVNEREDARLYTAIKNYMQKHTVWLDEVIPF